LAVKIKASKRLGINLSKGEQKMAGLSLSDMEALPDPFIENIARAILQIMNSPTPTIHAIQTEIILKGWRKADVSEAWEYAISKGWLSKENGIVEITENGRKIA
jgi:hypothetical protein